MRKLGIYTRVSTEEQAARPEGSIKNQGESLKRFAAGENLKHDNAGEKLSKFISMMDIAVKISIVPELKN